MPRLIRVSAAVPWPAAKIRMVSARATAVESRPLISVARSAVARPGAASSRRQGSSESSSPPSAGR